MPEPISRIDVQEGRLYFRGRDAVGLARSEHYESVLHLLCSGQLPSASQLGIIRSQMSKLRQRFGEHAISIGSHAASSADALIGLAAYLDGFGNTLPERLLVYVILTPLTVCACWRAKHGLDPIPPKKNLGHTANVLWMMGKESDSVTMRQFETSIMLHMDDPDNPSLSALQDALEGNQTVSDALAAAITEHVKPLHHGAGALAMEMLSRLRDSGDSGTQLEEWVRRGERIYGLGHRVYRTIDPRAALLQETLRDRSRGTPNEWLLVTTDAVATMGSGLLRQQKGKEFFPNVDLYNAAVYSTFGLSAEFNADLFAISRVAGWMAHVLELEPED